MHWMRSHPLTFLISCILIKAFLNEVENDVMNWNRVDVRELIKYALVLHIPSTCLWLYPPCFENLWTSSLIFLDHYSFFVNFWFAGWRYLWIIFLINREFFFSRWSWCFLHEFYALKRINSFGWCPHLRNSKNEETNLFNHQYCFIKMFKLQVWRNEGLRYNKLKIEDLRIIHLNIMMMVSRRNN